MTGIVGKKLKTAKPTGPRTSPRIPTRTVDRITMSSLTGLMTCWNYSRESAAFWRTSMSVDVWSPARRYDTI